MSAAEFLERNEWCQGAYARDKDGDVVGCFDYSACQWCIYGVLHRCYPTVTGEIAALEKVAATLGDTARGVVRWNDAPGRTKAEVVDLLRKAGV